MNESRTSYVKILPLVFLAGLLTAALWIYRDYQYVPDKPAHQLWYLDWPINIFRNAVLWLAIGYAFRQLKAAGFALAATLLLSVADYLFYKFEIAKSSVVFSTLYSLLFNTSFLPTLVFGLICFKKRGLRYFLPLWLLSYAFTMLFVGGAYLDSSPYNGWYRFLRIENLLQVRTGEHSYRVLNFFSYLFNIIGMAATVIIVGECYAAATANKKWKTLFHIDLSTNYTKAGAITLFYTLRLMINLLVIGLFTFPIAHFFESGRVYYRGQSWFSFFLTLTGGLALLTGTVLYYRRFMVEYFISHHRKIQWLFWIVNIPIAGMLVFPFIALTNGTGKPVAARTCFFYNNAMYNLQPYVIMGVMLGLSLIGSWFGRSTGQYNDVYWMLWVIEVALFIWYVAAVTGYYVILGAAVLGLIIFFCRTAIEVQALSGLKETYNVYGARSTSLLFNQSIVLYFIAAFNVVQYAILLPVFHLNAIKIIQEEGAVTGSTLQDTGVTVNAIP